MLTVIYDTKSMRVHKSHIQWSKLIENMTGTCHSKANIVGISEYSKDQQITNIDRMFTYTELEHLKLDQIDKILLIHDFRAYCLGASVEVEIKRSPISVVIRSSSISLISKCLLHVYCKVKNNSIFIDYIQTPSTDLEYSIFYRLTDKGIEPAHIASNNSHLPESIINWFKYQKCPQYQKCQIPSIQDAQLVLGQIVDLVPMNLHEMFYVLFPYSVAMLKVSHSLKGHLRYSCG